MRRLIVLAALIAGPILALDAQPASACCGGMAAGLVTGIRDADRLPIRLCRWGWPGWGGGVAGVGGKRLQASPKGSPECLAWLERRHSSALTAARRFGVCTHCSCNSKA